MLNRLIRTSFDASGIESNFIFEGDAKPFMVCLTHAYAQDDGTYLPKVYDGTFSCVRGTHALANGVPFETFEITGVEGHSGILFHPGNFNKDSEGCELCGQTEMVQKNGEDMITGSRAEFANFMARLDGVDQFDLLVGTYALQNP